MIKVEDKFPNIFNSNAMKLEDIAIKSLTDDEILKPEQFFKYAEFSLDYILNHLSEYGDEPKLRKPEYIHKDEKSFISLLFIGSSNIHYQVILERTGRSDGVDIISYFIKKNTEGSILEVHRIKDDVISQTEENVDPRNTDLYSEVLEVIEDISILKEESK